jgi:hypothetical protein
MWMVGDCLLLHFAVEGGEDRVDVADQLQRRALLPARESVRDEMRHQRIHGRRLVPFLKMEGTYERGIKGPLSGNDIKDADKCWDVGENSCVCGLYMIDGRLIWT